MDDILELLKLELESLYSNLRFEDAQFNRYRTMLGLTQIDVFICQQEYLDVHKIWAGLCSISLNRHGFIHFSWSTDADIDCDQYINIQISTIDLTEPNSIEKLCEMLDKKGGQRKQRLLN